MLICASLLVIILGYATISVFPNLFYKKGYTEAQQRSLIVVAHRGGSSLGPENTLLAIERGIQAGADMVEIDIHQTRDGQLVVCHDESIDRTTDGSGLIRELTFDEIRSYNIVDANGNKTDLKIPTLDEVLELVNGRVKLLIEIKRTNDIYQGIEKQMVDAVKAHDAMSWVVGQSFNDSVLENLHAECLEMRLEKLWICKFAGIPVGYDGTFSRYDYDKYSYVSSFNFFKSAVTDVLVDEIHRHGKEVKIWTVMSPAETPTLSVDGIITDSPNLWR